MTKKKIPQFENEDAERAFWSKNDSTEFIDWKQAEATHLPELAPSVRTISLRLPEYMIEELKGLANQKDVPYQSLLKVFLAERIEKELGDREKRLGVPHRARIPNKAKRALAR